MTTLYIDWEALMRQAITTAALAAALVFVGGVIFGWEYSLFLGFTVLFGISLVELLRRRQ